MGVTSSSIFFTIKIKTRSRHMSCCFHPWRATSEPFSRNVSSRPSRAIPKLNEEVVRAFETRLSVFSDRTRILEEADQMYCGEGFRFLVAILEWENITEALVCLHNRV